jgi:multiple sugar transport system ATP-binding protein
VIVGVRPEHFEDVALIDAYDRIKALVFPVQVDLVESLGADKYLHFNLGGAAAQSEQLAELAADSGGGTGQYVARVSAESAAGVGQSVELALDTGKVSVFDADSGVNLTVPVTGT